MKKPHWEVITSSFPGLKTEVRWGEISEKVGPAGRLGAIRARLEDLEGSGYGIKNVDGSILLHAGIAAQLICFNADGQKIYKIGREFGADLLNVKLDITAIHLPLTQGIVCLEFPENMRFDLGGGKFAHCVYLFSSDERIILNADGKRNIRNVDGKLRKRYLQLLIPLYEANGNMDRLEVQEFGLSIFSLTEPLSKCVLDSVANSEYKFTNLDFINFVINCLVYLESGDPDLRDYRAPKAPITRDPKKQRRWAKEHANQSLINMTLVGYNWKKEIQYSVDSTVRRGHTRWQPYKPDGPGTDWKVKLIWLEPTTIRYKRAKSGAGALPTP